MTTFSHFLVSLVSIFGVLAAFLWLGKLVILPTVICTLWYVAILFTFWRLLFWSHSKQMSPPTAESSPQPDSALSYLDCAEPKMWDYERFGNSAFLSIMTLVIVRMPVSHSSYQTHAQLLDLLNIWKWLVACIQMSRMKLFYPVGKVLSVTWIFQEHTGQNRSSHSLCFPILVCLYH